jgi:carbon-monoxide dehydrogenase medium subunit
MYQFNYRKASSVAHAADLRADAEDGAYLAGGMTLIPTLKQRLAAPSDVIDVGGLADLRGIDVGTTVSIGALTTHAEVAASAEVRGAIAALSDLAEGIGDAHVRNRGTIGGSVANSDPAADYPAAVVALGATVHTNQRSIAGDDFFTDLFETALEDGEIITSIEFPIPARAAYAKFPNPASRYAIVGVMVAEVDGAVRVGVTGAGACAFRSAELESALADGLSVRALDGVSVPSGNLNSDLHASAEYRAHLVVVMAKRAVARLA